MNTEQKRAIKSTILECRGILEKDIEQVLINLGIYIDEEWVDINNLTNLNEEQRKIRENIEQVIEKLCKGGFDKNKAVTEYIKEVSYTYLNRIAALRVLEVRGLIDEMLISRPENGDKSFINSRFYEVAREYCKYNMDAGLSYIINLMFEEIGEEIKLLFSTEDEYSFISPSSNGLLTIIKLLCTDIDEESWQQDEIIGWIYQYFNDKEKDDVFDRLYNKKQKIKVEDIPAATQLFTPNWIVQWIVDNSLGTLWDEIKEGKRQGKKVEEIKLLDPCCGSGHFLVKTYDLFYQMYLEEGIYSKEEIPFKILENNIHGIDIDLRAVQLSGLILFIKAKSCLKENNININTKGKLVLNLVCADAILLNGSRLEELRKKYSKNPVVLKMLDIIYEEFKDVRLKGSLIQPEKKLFPLFEETKHKAEKRLKRNLKKIKGKQSKGQITLENSEILNEIEIGNFSKEDQSLINTLVMVYNEAVRSNDINKQLFANEAVKSVKLIEIFMKEYDIVVTNPPYMGKRGMNDKLKEFLQVNYGDNFVDLYSSFIDRCLDFVKENGYVGMVTQHSFMFTSSFTSLREEILTEFYISSLCHLGSKAFSDISGEKVNTVMFVFNKNKLNIKNKGKYIRLTNYMSSNDKENALRNLSANDVFYVQQDNFKKIEGWPFTYWSSEKVFDLFNKCKPFEKYAKPKQGMATGNNAKYLRFKWELDCKEDWNIYSKIIDNSEYYTYYPTYVYWKNNGEQIRRDPSSAIRGEDSFFKEGIMYSLIGNKFKSRYLPKGIIFDKGNSCIFPIKFDIKYLLAFTNSKVFSYFMNILNPTHNFQVGDIKRIPVIEPDKSMIIKLSSMIDEIISEREKILKNEELSDNFNFINYKYTSFNEFLMDKFEKEFISKIKIKFWEEKIDKVFFEIYELSDSDLLNIENEFGKLYFNKFEGAEQLLKYISESSQISADNNYVNELLVKNDYDVLKVVDETEYCVEELIKVIVENNLYDYRNTVNFINTIVSYCYDQIYKNNIEGIEVTNNTIYSENLIEKIYDVLAIVFADENLDKVIDEIEGYLQQSIEKYVVDTFFKNHITKYQKRPIYWHVCSPKKTFNCFVNYHKLDEDILYKIKSIYLTNMIERYEEDLKYYNEQLIKARIDSDKNKEKDFKNKCSDLEEKLEDLNNLDKKIMEILPYKPDLNKGVLYNIIPLEPILAARVSTDKEREEYYKEVKKK